MHVSIATELATECMPGMTSEREIRGEWGKESLLPQKKAVETYMLFD